MQTWKIPGVSVAIVRNDSVLYTKGFGTLAASSTTPVNDETLFEIGSSSKAFTATLVAMLVGDGKMRFDDRLTDYLPDFKMYDPVASAEVTLRDALTHRSGIARGELVWLGVRHRRATRCFIDVRFLKPESPFRSQLLVSEHDVPRRRRGRGESRRHARGRISFSSGSSRRSA